MEGLRYTIVNEETGGEAVLDIAKEGDQFTLSVFNARVYIGSQQLFELGNLFIALAGKGNDQESVDELLDGYGLTTGQNEVPNAEYYSVWDDGVTMGSRAVVKDGMVECLDFHEKDDDSTLEREYVVFLDDKDEEEHEVCTQCHERLLRTVMVDDSTGAGQHEDQVCPYCDS